MQAGKGGAQSTALPICDAYELHQWPAYQGSSKGARMALISVTSNCLIVFKTQLNRRKSCLVQET